MFKGYGKVAAAVKAAKKASERLYDEGKLTMPVLSRRLRIMDEKLEGIGRAPRLDLAEVDVAWRPSRVCGWNPRAKAFARADDGTSVKIDSLSVSGLGADRLSAAVGRCLQKLDAGLGLALSRILAENPETWDCKAVSVFYGVPEWDLAWKGIETLKDVFAHVRGYRLSVDRLTADRTTVSGIGSERRTC